MNTELIEAAKAIVHQRDYMADHGHYDKTESNPHADGDTRGYEFDDWAADILEAALNAPAPLLDAVAELLDNRSTNYLHSGDREMLKEALLPVEQLLGRA